MADLVSSQVLQKTLDELRNITRIDLCVTNTDGVLLVTTFPETAIDAESIRSFVLSAADSQIVQEYHYFKVYDNQNVEYILISKGSSDDAYMIGKVAVCEIQNLIIAYKERLDKNNFIQNLLLDNLLLVDVYNRAKKLRIDTDVRRTFATGIAGFSHVIDSLSAIKYAKVKVVRDETGLATGYEVEGDFPKYGNDDDRADEIGVWLLRTFLEMIKKRHTYRNSEATTSILTITSNVVYGKYTGALPDGRAAFTPFAPGANPSYGAEQNGLLASLNSVAKLPYHWALDGISNTQTINPDALGHSEGERVENLVQVMDGYFDQGAHHLNVNVFGKEKLLDAMEHPEKEEYANFTIRVSGYAVKFIDLTREQQLDVLARTCHGVL